MGTLTTISGFLIVIYKYVIKNPIEWKRQSLEAQKAHQLNKSIAEKNEPLLKTLEELNESMKKREAHDNKLDTIADQNQQILRKHDERLDDHHERLIVLEVKNNVRKVGYVEDKGGENK